MKHNKMNKALLLNLLTWVVLLQPEGFSAGVSIYAADARYIPIEKLIVGENVISSHSNAVVPVYPITHIQRCIVNSYVEITIGDCSVSVASDQKFYVPAQKSWVNASQLKQYDVLLCCNDKKITIDAIRTVHEQQEMFVLSVDTSHIFCVTPHRILAHNAEPVGTVIATTLTVVFPPAAPVIAVGEIIALGIIGILAYRDYKKPQRHKAELEFSRISNNDQQIARGCFPTDSRFNGVDDCQLISDAGCFSKRPVELNTGQGCGIVVDDSPNCEIIIPLEQLRVDNVGCAFPAVKTDQPLYETMQKDSVENTGKSLVTSIEQKLQPLNRGNTGRSIPANLDEQIVL